MDALVVAALRRIHHGVRRITERWRALPPSMPLSVKAACFGLILLWVQQSAFAFWPITLFIILSILFYMQPVHKPFIMKASFLLLMSTALLLTSRFTIVLPVEFHASIYGQLLFSLVFSFLFFVLIAVKNGVMVRRREWQMVLFIGLMYSINLLFFTVLIGAASWGIGVIFIICTYALCYEYFASQEEHQGRPLGAVAGVFTLLLLEFGWIVSILPLGFSKAASFGTLLAMIMVSVVDRYLRGTLSARWLRTSFVLFCILTTALALSVRWTI